MFNRVLKALPEKTNKASRLYRDRSGNTAIIFALLLPILIGFIGLSTDVALWNWEDRKLQATTDGAALAAGYEMLSTSDTGILQSSVNTLLQAAYPGSSSVALVSVTRPPTSGNFTSDNTAVEVIVRNQVGRYFSILHAESDVDLQARAVAQITETTGFCLLGLSETLDKAVQFSGNADVDLGCGIAVNSNSDESLYVGGTVRVTASPLSTAGKMRLVGSGEVISPSPVKELSAPVTDPYSSLGLPSGPSGCTYNNYVSTGTNTLSPGRYCNGLRFQGGNATLQPGTYIIDGGDFRSGGNANIQGEGVTIILTGNGNNYAEMDIQGGTTLDLSAPAAGSGGNYEGILIYQDRDAPMYQGSQLRENKINGGTDMKLRGVIYFPSQELVFTGGASGNIDCLKIIAQQISFYGNANIKNNCTSDDAGQEIVQQYVKLVE